MSDLSAANCGCNNNNSCGCGILSNSCGNNCSWLWIIILLVVFCGGNNGILGGNSCNDNCDCGHRHNNNNCCDIIIILVLLSVFCGNGNGNCGLFC